MLQDSRPLGGAEEMQLKEILLENLAETKKDRVDKGTMDRGKAERGQPTNLNHRIPGEGRRFEEDKGGNYVTGERSEKMTEAESKKHQQQSRQRSKKDGVVRYFSCEATPVADEQRTKRWKKDIQWQKQQVL